MEEGGGNLMARWQRLKKNPIMAKLNWTAQAERWLRHIHRQETALGLVGTWHTEDELTSPLLPGLAVRVASLFE